MAIINLNVKKIDKIKHEILTLDNTLIKNYLPELENELNKIRVNIQGEDLLEIINNISSDFKLIKTELSHDLPKLEEFLETQLSTYNQNEEELMEELDYILGKMEQFIFAINHAPDYNDPLDVSPSGDIIQQEDGKLYKYYGPNNIVEWVKKSDDYHDIKDSYVDAPIYNDPLDVGPNGDVIQQEDGNLYKYYGPDTIGESIEKLDDLLDVGANGDVIQQEDGSLYKYYGPDNTGEQIEILES